MNGKSIKSELPVVGYEDIPFPVIVQLHETGNVVGFNKAAKQFLKSGLVVGQKLKIKWPAPLKQKFTKRIDGKIYLAKNSIKDVSEFPIHGYRKVVVRNRVKYVINYFEPRPDHREAVSINNHKLNEFSCAFVYVTFSLSVLEWNLATENLFGWKRKDAIGKQLSDLIFTPNLRNKTKKIFSTISNGQLIEVVGHHKDGHEFPAELTVSTVIKDGVKFFLIMLRDSAERKLMEEKLKKSETSLNRAQAIASVGNWEMSDKFQDIYWSDEFYRIHGLEPQSVKPSKNLRLKMVHRHDRSKLELAIHSAFKKGKPYSIEKRIVRPDGEVRWVLSQGKISVDSITGNKKIVGTLLDITKRKGIEQEQLEVKNRLRQALIFSRIGTADLDVNTGILVVDKELLLLLEEDDTVLNTMPIDQFFKKYVIPEDIIKMKDKIKEGISKAVTVENDVWVNFRVMTCRGNLLHIEAQVTFSRNGKAIGILRDVTRNNSAEHEVRTKSKFIETIFFGITEGFFATDKNLNFTLVNPVFSKQANMMADEMVGQNMISLFPFMKNSKLLEIYKQAIKTGESSMTEQQNPLSLDQISQLNIYPNSQGLFVHYKDVSVTRKSELDIVFSRNDLSSLIENLPGYIYRVKNDAEFTPLFIGGQVEAVTGYRADEYLISKTVSCGKKIHKEDYKKISDLVQQSLVTRSSYECEYRIITKQGKEKWVWKKGKGVFDEHDQFLYLEGFVMDISDRKEAEIGLMNSEEKFRILYNNTPALMHSMNTEGKLIRVSDYWLQRMEYTRGEVLGKMITDFLTDSSRNKMLREYVPGFFTSGYINSVALQFVTKSGKVLDTILSSTCEYGVNGNVVKSLAVITDITESNNLAERLRVVSENLPSVAIYQYEVSSGDFDGNYKYYSSGVKRITGMTADELLGNPLLFEENIHPVDRKEKAHRIQLANKNQTVFDQVYRFKHRNGTWRWLRTRSQPTLQNDGSTLWNGLIIDMTEQKDAEKNLLFARFTIDHASDLIFWIRPDASIEDINPAAHKSLGYSFEEMLLMKVSDFDESYSETGWPLYWQGLREKRTATFTSRLKRKDGVEFDVEINANFIVFQDQEFNCSFIRDITDRKIAEDHLRLNWETYKSLFETNPLPLWIYDEETLEFVQVNDTAVIKYGYTKEEFSKMTILDIRSEVESRKLAEVLKTRIKDYNHSNGWKHKRKDGSVVEVEIYSHVLYHNGRKCRFVIANDISDRRRAQQELNESEQRFNAFMKHTPLSSWIMDGNGIMKYVNDSYYSMFEFGKENAAVGKSVFDLYPENIAQQIVDNNQTVVMTGEALQTIELVPRIDNSKGEFLVYRFPMGNNLIGGIAADVTIQRKTERDVQTALQEKEVLIKEIHHRVKNNLQLISSIIYLKMQNMTQSDIRSFLEETRKKIRTISLIHERLLQTESVNQIDIADYLGKLITDLQMTNTRQDLVININSVIEPFQMKLDMAIYYGLIVNELVTNSIKHAFVNRTSGNIKVILQKLEGHNHLIVSDDGSSLPLDIAPEKSGSFGMQLLNIFIKQLNGEMEIDRGSGTTFSIYFMEIAPTKSRITS